MKIDNAGSNSDIVAGGRGPVDSDQSSYETEKTTGDDLFSSVVKSTSNDSDSSSSEDAPNLSSYEKDEIVERIDDLDIMAQTVERDDQEISVSEAVEIDLIEKLNEMHADGDLKETDPRYKFLMAVRSKMLSANGGELRPYYEEPFGNGTERLQGAETEIPQADMAALFNDEEIDKVLEEMGKSEEVLEERNKILDDIFDELDVDKDDLKEDIESLIKDKEYAAYIEELMKTNNSEQAMEDQQRLLSSYAAVASEDEVNALMSEMALGEMAEQLNDAVSNPEDLSVEDYEKATADFLQTFFFSTALTSKYLANEVFKNATEVNKITAMVSNLLSDKKMMRLFAKAIKDVAVGAAKDGVPTAKGIEKAVSDVLNDKRSASPLAGMDSKTRDLFKTLLLSPLSGTLVGITSLGAGIYQLTDGNFGDTPRERLQAAASFTFAACFTDDALNLADKALGRFLTMGDTASFFASDDMIDRLAKEQKYYNSGVESGKFRARVLKSRDYIGFQYFGVEGHHPNDAETSILADRMDGKNGVKPSVARNIATNASKVFSAANFVGWGVLSVAIGALDLKDSLEEGDAFASTNAVNGIISGGFGTAAGVAWGMKTIGFSSFGAFMNPLGIATAIFAMFALTGGVIKMLVDAIKNDDILSEEQTDFFHDLDKMGLLSKDGLAKYEFLVKSYFHGANMGTVGDDDGFDHDDDMGVRPLTAPGESVFEAYDYKGWLKDYEEAIKPDRNRGERDYEEWLEDEDLEDNFRNAYRWNFLDRPMDPMEYRTDDYDARTEPDDRDSILRDVADAYAEEIGEFIENDERKVPDISKKGIKAPLEELAAYYFENMNMNGSVIEGAKWASRDISSWIESSFEDEDKGEEARDIFEGWLNKHGGQEKLEGLFQDVQNDLVWDNVKDKQLMSNAAFDNDLNGAVTIYTKRISLARRVVPSLTGDLKKHVREMFVYYYERINANGSSSDAAEWVIDRIHGRLAGAYTKDEDDMTAEERGRLADDIFDGYIDKSGEQLFEDLGADVRNDLFGEMEYF